ncbi:unnamed protein product [Ambrosiozyma monospora]|uniref:Unnamed protein product n=1 Tax=Ambrosiozyma monospora TaxID=43982 RepID=A0ACB5SR19_AMBMO|nr:unnamed protein product [Ambrosiozyma monospora]
MFLTTNTEPTISTLQPTQHHMEILIDDWTRSIYITPLLTKANYSFDHLHKPAFTTHRIIELHISISKIETGRPIYTIRNNICENKALSPHTLPLSTTHQKLLSTSIDLWETATTSATAILNLNETYKHLRKRAKTNRNSQLIAAINDPTEKKRKYTTPEIASVFTQYNKQVFQKQAQQQEAKSSGNHRCVEPTSQLSDEEQNSLAEPITLDEIYQANDSKS